MMFRFGRLLFSFNNAERQVNLSLLSRCNVNFEFRARTRVRMRVRSRDFVWLWIQVYLQLPVDLIRATITQDEDPVLPLSGIFVTNCLCVNAANLEYILEIRVEVQ